MNEYGLKAENLKTGDKIISDDGQSATVKKTLQIPMLKNDNGTLIATGIETAVVLDADVIDNVIHSSGTGLTNERLTNWKLNTSDLEGD